MEFKKQPLPMMLANKNTLYPVQSLYKSAQCSLTAPDVYLLCTKLGNLLCLEYR